MADNRSSNTMAESTAQIGQASRLRNDKDQFSFRKLPTELQFEIVKGLVTDDPYETARNLNRFSESSKYSRDLVLIIPQMKGLRTELNQAGSGAVGLLKGLAFQQAESNEIIDEVSLSGSYEDEPETPTEANFRGMNPYLLATHGPILGFVSRSRRSELVTAVLEIEDQEEQAVAIAGLGPGVKYLHPNETSDLLLATLNLENSGCRTVAITGTGTGAPNPYPQDGLAAGIAHFRPSERSTIVKNGLLMRDPALRARMVGALGPKFGYLKSSEVQNLVRTIHDSSHPRALGDCAILAIAELGPGFEFVSRSDRKKILKVVSDPNHPHAPNNSLDRAYAVGCLGSGLGHFERNEITDLYEMVSDTTHANPLTGVDEVSQVLAGWGSGLEHFNEKEIDMLTRKILDPDDLITRSDGRYWAKAISGIGPSLNSVSTKERSTLVQTALDLNESAVGVNRVMAIAGFGKGLKYLAPEERSALVDAAIAYQNTKRAFVIAGLGQGLEHLNQNDRARLGAAAQELSDTQFEWGIGIEHDDRTLAMYGLGVGAQDWATNLLARSNQVRIAGRTQAAESSLDERQRLGISLE